MTTRTTVTEISAKDFGITPKKEYLITSNKARSITSKNISNFRAIYKTRLKSFTLGSRNFLKNKQ